MLVLALSPLKKPTKYKYENKKLRKQNEKIVHTEKNVEFSLCLLTLPARACLSVVVYPRHSIMENWFPLCQQALNINSFSGVGRSCVYFFHSVLDLIWLKLYKFGFAATVCVSSYVHRFFCV